MSDTTIKCVQGDTCGPIVFAFKDADGNPFDLTGSVLSIRIKTAGPTLELVSTDGNGLQILDAVAGKATLTLTGAQTQTFLPGPNGLFRVRRTIAGIVTTMVYGKFDAAVGGP